MTPPTTTPELFDPPVVRVTSNDLPPSLQEVVSRRGFRTERELQRFLSPALEDLLSPDIFPHMECARDRLLKAIQNEERIGIYADRDVDGLVGLSILVRSLRTLGAEIRWGSPLKGRGIERPILERFLSEQIKLMIFVDCGTGEHEQLEWLASQGVEVIVADHHRMSEERPPAMAWIHPGALAETQEVPAGCVMAFKLAHAVWLSFLGTHDPERLDYFLFSHLDILALGILADRVPLIGENRVFVSLGLKRLAATRKPGLESLMRFFHLIPRTSSMTVDEASWQIIPLLNAAGRLGRPDITAELLLTEDPPLARERVDQLLALNTQRRDAQDKSLEHFEQAVLEQCSIENDSVLIAMGTAQEPSVTGLAAGALVKKYGRPVFLFVNQGDETVGSGRGIPGVDLFAWIQGTEKWLIKFGGHEGAVGLTIRTADFSAFRECLQGVASKRVVVLPTADENGFVVRAAQRGEIAGCIEAELPLSEIDDAWWLALERVGPFGQGHPWPVFKITAIDAVLPVLKPRSKKPCDEIIFKSGAVEMTAFLDDTLVAAFPALLQDNTAGSWCAVGYPAPGRKAEGGRKWIIQDIRRIKE